MHGERLSNEKFATKEYELVGDVGSKLDETIFGVPFERVGFSTSRLLTDIRYRFHERRTSTEAYFTHDHGSRTLEDTGHKLLTRRLRPGTRKQTTIICENGAGNVHKREHRVRDIRVGIFEVTTR